MVQWTPVVDYQSAFNRPAREDVMLLGPHKANNYNVLFNYYLHYTIIICFVVWRSSYSEDFRLTFILQQKCP